MTILRENPREMNFCADEDDKWRVHEPQTHTFYFDVMTNGKVVIEISDSEEDSNVIIEISDADDDCSVVIYDSDFDSDVMENSVDEKRSRICEIKYEKIVSEGACDSTKFVKETVGKRTTCQLDLKAEAKKDDDYPAQEPFKTTAMGLKGQRLTEMECRNGQSKADILVDSLRKVNRKKHRKSVEGPCDSTSQKLKRRKNSRVNVGGMNHPSLNLKCASENDKCRRNFNCSNEKQAQRTSKPGKRRFLDAFGILPENFLRSCDEESKGGTELTKNCVFDCGKSMTKGETTVCSDNDPSNHDPLNSPETINCASEFVLLNPLSPSEIINERVNCALNSSVEFSELQSDDLTQLFLMPPEVVIRTDCNSQDTIISEIELNISTSSIEEVTPTESLETGVNVDNSVLLEVDGPRLSSSLTPLTSSNPSRPNEVPSHSQLNFQSFVSEDLPSSSSEVVPKQSELLQMVPSADEKVTSPLKCNLESFEFPASVDSTLRRVYEQTNSPVTRERGRSDDTLPLSPFSVEDDDDDDTGEMEVPVLKLMKSKLDTISELEEEVEEVALLKEVKDDVHVGASETDVSVRQVRCQSPEPFPLRKVTVLDRCRWRRNEVTAEHFPFPVQYVRKVQRSTCARDFDFGMMSVIEANICSRRVETAVKLVESFTSQSWRPPFELMCRLFDWLTEANSEIIVKHLSRTLGRVLQLHGIPKELPLWDYLEKAYYLDEFAVDQLNLLVKNTVLQFVCTILEMDLFESDTDLHRTQAYRLMSVKSSYGNVKTVVAWLEDTVKFYEGVLESPEKSVPSVDSQLYSNIISLQKLLAFSLIISQDPKVCGRHLAREMKFAYDRLKTLGQRRLFLDTVQSDLALMYLCEKIFEHMDALSSRLCEYNRTWQPFEELRTSLSDHGSMKRKIRQYFELQVPCDEKESVAVICNYLHLLVLWSDAYDAVVRGESEWPLHQRTLNSDDIKILPFHVAEKHISRLQIRLDNQFPHISHHPDILLAFDVLKFHLIVSRGDAKFEN